MTLQRLLFMYWALKLGFVFVGRDGLRTKTAAKNKYHEQ